MSSQELPVESVSVTGDPSGRAGSKMGAKPDSLTFCGILQTPQARRTGRACKFAVHRVELRVVHLQRVMQNIAREKGLLALRLNADGHVIKAVTGRGNEMHAVEHFAATAWDEARLSALITGNTLSLKISIPGIAASLSRAGEVKCSASVADIR